MREEEKEEWEEVEEEDHTRPVLWGEMQMHVVAKSIWRKEEEESEPSPSLPIYHPWISMRGLRKIFASLVGVSIREGVTEKSTALHVVYNSSRGGVEKWSEFVCVII